MTIVTEPGVYDLTDEEYHADPCPETSLSQSGAKDLLDSPALFAWRRDHRDDKPEYDFGHVAHRLILGTGTTPYVVDATDWRTKAAQDARRDARAQGLAPILRADYVKAVRMAHEVRKHPIAGRLFNGDSEVSMFARCPDTKVMLRARADHIGTLPSGRPVIVDYKTAGRTANPAIFGRSAWEYGYDIQDAWYRQVALDSGAVDDDPAFLFVIQSKDAPHLVAVVELDDEARETGSARGLFARRLYLECATTGHWPGYAPVVHTASLPRYASAPHIEGVPA